MICRFCLWLVDSTRRILTTKFRIFAFVIVILFKNALKVFRALNHGSKRLRLPNIMTGIWCYYLILWSQTRNKRDLNLEKISETSNMFWNIYNAYINIIWVYIVHTSILFEWICWETNECLLVAIPIRWNKMPITVIAENIAERSIYFFQIAR